MASGPARRGKEAPPGAGKAGGDAVLGDLFRESMSQLVTGVVMVTSWLEGKPWGLTVSACCSVSVDPPLLLVSLSRETASSKAIDADGGFGVSILGERLIDVARFGAAKGQPKFVERFCRSGEEREESPRSPVVAGALAHIDCTVHQKIEAGDHAIYLGRVGAVLVENGDRPLVYYARTYHRLAGSSDLGVGPVADETVDSLLYDYPLPRQFRALQRAPSTSTGSR
jgi:flavin reductase ActVB